MPEFRVHDGRHSADDYRQLASDLTMIVEGVMAEILANPEQARDVDVDRGAVREAFDRNGFYNEYFSLDFEAALPEFLAALEYIHQYLIPDWQAVAEQYPSGVVEVSAPAVTDETGQSVAASSQAAETLTARHLS